MEVIKDDSLKRDERYRSRIYKYNLLEVFKRLSTRISANCSNEIIFALADNIKKLRFDFPQGINISIKIKHDEYFVKCEIVNEDLNIRISEKNNIEKIRSVTTLNNFVNLTNEQTKKSFITILKEFGIKYYSSKDNESNLRVLINALTNGSYYSFSDDTISKLNEQYHHNEKIIKAFSIIFRDLLNNKVKQNVEEGIRLLELFTYDNKYRLSFFRRVVLFVISDNWQVTKKLFWNIVNENDQDYIFSNYILYKDLYELLNKNQMLFDERELSILERIINLGPQENISIKKINDTSYWQLRWYSALRNIPQFIERYNKFSLSENLTHEYFENLGVVRVMSGSISPINIQEILQKNTKEIAEFIHSFKPKDRWEEPNIEGLSDTLNRAVANEPQKFSSEIELFRDIYYVYAYQFANGFIEAWKNEKPFNWEKVLFFFREYISSEKFNSGQLYLDEDDSGATVDWVIGAVARLLTEGMKSDDNAFDLSLLPVAKDILLILATKLKAVEDYKEINMDYPTYTLNSIAGKIIRALLDYSLIRARNLEKDSKLPKWEEDIQLLIDDTFKKGIIDGYVLTGWYFQQFYYLDKNWITTKVKDYYNLADQYWISFISGFVFGNPPFNKSIYKLFYPHYERAIRHNIKIKNFHDNGLIRHIGTFYFWGFEDLNTNGLLLILLDKGNHADILELVNFICSQEKYIQELKDDEKKNFERIVFDLWTNLANKYANAIEEDEQKILVALSNFLELIPELNEGYTKLVLKSTKVIDRDYHPHSLVENLIKFKDKGISNETAKYVGDILNTIQFGSYFTSIDNNYIIDLVVFLYENGQKGVADEFCNKMVKQGYEFLIEVHNRFKE